MSVCQPELLQRRLVLFAVSILQHLHTMLPWPGPMPFSLPWPRPQPTSCPCVAAPLLVYCSCTRACHYVHDRPIGSAQASGPSESSCSCESFTSRSPLVHSCCVLCLQVSRHPRLACCLNSKHHSSSISSRRTPISIGRMASPIMIGRRAERPTPLPTARSPPPLPSRIPPGTGLLIWTPCLLPVL